MLEAFSIFWNISLGCSPPNGLIKVYKHFKDLLYIIKLFSICIHCAPTSSYESAYLSILPQTLNIEIFFLIFANVIELYHFNLYSLLLKLNTSYVSNNMHFRELSYECFIYWGYWPFACHLLCFVFWRKIDINCHVFVECQLVMVLAASWEDINMYKCPFRQEDYNFSGETGCRMCKKLNDTKIVSVKWQFCRVEWSSSSKVQPAISWSERDH